MENPYVDQEGIDEAAKVAEALSARPMQSLEFNPNMKGPRNSGEVISVLANGKTVRVDRFCRVPKDFPNGDGWECGVWECEVTDRGRFATARPLRRCPQWVEYYKACDEVKAVSYPSHVSPPVAQAIGEVRAGLLEKPLGGHVRVIADVKKAMQVVDLWLASPEAVTYAEASDAQQKCSAARQQADRISNKLVGGPHFNTLSGAGVRAIDTSYVAGKAWHVCNGMMNEINKRETAKAALELAIMQAWYPDIGEATWKLFQVTPEEVEASAPLLFAQKRHGDQDRYGGSEITRYGYGVSPTVEEGKITPGSCNVVAIAPFKEKNCRYNIVSCTAITSLIDMPHDGEGFFLGAAEGEDWEVLLKIEYLDYKNYSVIRRYCHHGTFAA